MRVLLINTYHYARGGTETHVFALAELLRSHGHEVRFFGMHHRDNVPCEDSDYWVPEIDFVELNRRKSLRAGWQVASRTFYYREARRRLDSMLDGWRPDVAHVHNIHGHLSPSVLDSLASHRVPVVWTLHDYRLLCPNTHFLSNGRVCEECKVHRYWRCAANRCKKGSLAASTVAALEPTVHRFLHIADKVSAFVAPSRFLRDKFVEFGFPAEKVRFVRNFLPSSPDPRPLDPSGPAAYVGQLAPWKGVDVAIRALASLPGRRMLVIGGGPDRERLTALAADLGVADRVEFTGALGHDAVLSALEPCAFVVVPSVWYENCPYTVMEALAAGRPVVASDIGGLPELVADGRDGLVVPPGDADALAVAMRSLWDDPELLRRMSTAAVEASAEFAPGAYHDAIAALYAEVTAPAV